MANVLTIAKALIALADIIPFARALFDKLTELWVDQRIKEIDGVKIGRAEKRKALTNALKGAKTNEERMAISIMLHDLNKLQGS